MPFRVEVGAEPITGYRLLSPLGRGGFGEVWKAEAPGGFQVALKFIRIDTGQAKPELRALEAIRAVRHPHLLDIQFSVQVAEWLVIATSLCDRSLWDRFLECKQLGLSGIPADELLGYVMETAKAIDFLNEPRHKDDGGSLVSVQHRDVKPHNIFLVGGSIKLADFGLAKVLEHSVASNTGSMTPAYAPPEMFQSRVSAHSDQYSLAVTYCQLRGGRLPFNGTLHELMYGHLQNEPDLSGLPDPERPVVARGLAKNPAERWPSCRAFVDQLQKVQAPSIAAIGPPALDYLGEQPATPTPLLTTLGTAETRNAATPLAEPGRPSASLQPEEPGSDPRRAARLVFWVEAVTLLILVGITFWALDQNPEGWFVAAFAGLIISWFAAACLCFLSVFKQPWRQRWVLWMHMVVQLSWYPALIALSLGLFKERIDFNRGEVAYSLTVFACSTFLVACYLTGTAMALKRGPGSRRTVWVYFAGVALVGNYLSPWFPLGLESLHKTLQLNGRQFQSSKVNGDEVVFSGDGSQALANSGTLWEVSSGRVSHRFEGRQAIFSSDGRHVLADELGHRYTYGKETAYRVVLWDLESRRELRSFSATGSCQGIAVSLDGRRVIVCIHDKGQGFIHQWDLETGKGLKRIELQETVEWMEKLVFSPDGSYLFGRPAPSPTAAAAAPAVWDAETGKKIFALEGATLAAFFPDSRSLAAADDGRIKLVDVKTGKTTQWGSEALTGEITSLAVSPDGKRLLTGDGDSRVRLWDLDNGREVFNGRPWFREGAKQVSWLAFSPDGQSALAMYDNRRVRFWRLPN